ncbi:hypothetical protein [Bradyrhizobium paxllaeri]|uniref:hypothetical protein n=1 Tax=Bradyrhizobium paxllaeri TaxID=190148 RepID=UPI000810B6EE|nr:hypothetical protein [Bradyrhizobium paxllaeri]
MQGNKTHEQQKRILERKEDVPSPNRSDAQKQFNAAAGSAKIARHGERQSEYPLSSGGMNQESDQNKHNHQTQQNHKPQRPERAQQKQD